MLSFNSRKRKLMWPRPLTAIQMKGLIAVTGGKGPITAAGGAGGRSPAQSAALRQGLLTLTYFGLWFALNVYYNIVNKKVRHLINIFCALSTSKHTDHVKPGEQRVMFEFLVVNWIMKPAVINESSDAC